ncbi:GPCR kinase [Trema orientale]|uniref:GPCR kinase n=1 Tax=Trema orientale TaxID=63057 RepID=A0A2P5ASX0_TREOI|nr:GPCR kinase [Trema orientale]
MAFRAEFVLVAFLVFVGFGSVDSDDGATLLEVKKSFRDVDNVLYDWTDSPSSDYCIWRGISCDNVTFSVLALDLRGNRLSGQIPDEIGDCSSLTSLILKNNRLIGPIPSTLSQIPNLKILDLAQNNLGGEIPRLIYWNEVLQYLGLRGNNLVGTLSPDMCQLTGLWYFDVRNNSLIGSIPQNIGNCTAFQVLDLSYNQLTGEIPFNIGFLQVATLSLQGNQLSGHIPSVIGLMQALAVLDLSCNMLSGPIPSILGNLTYTEKLYLHSNKLTGSIPPELGNMTKLHYLELNDNHLSGHIPPELGKLTNLFDLNVANNNLEGPIPENLSSCTNLNSLNVHGNKLNGTILTAFQKLESMTYLNLSSNNLQGPIPIELSRIVSCFMCLDCRDLSNNHLAGSIPQELSQLQNMFSLRLERNNLSGDVMSLLNCLSLAVLNVSYNNLAGNIPTNNNFSRFSPDSFIGNPALCGYWLSSWCHVSHSAERGKYDHLKWQCAGLTIQHLSQMVHLTNQLLFNGVPAKFYCTSETAVNYSKPKLVILHMNMALHVYEDIMRITENLSEKYIIGYGASSTVYKCVLKNCKPVAIKKLYSRYPQCFEQFETELKTVGNIKHRNLVSLQGYSLSASGYLLVYDYMENGSLWDLLHGPSKKKKLDWDTRLKIALGAAQGLAYLHHDCSPRIIHRDVKSSNILLDKDFEAHLTDFGIAKSLCISKSYTSTYIMGTIGYIDPEYARTSRLTEKSDVYSYGIVLLELLTGRKAVDNESNLHHLILSKTSNNAVMETVDPEITATCKDLGAVRKVFQLALLCAKQQPSDRPTMHEVTRVLGSLMPSTAPPKQLAGALPSSTLPSAKVPGYIDEYANIKTPHMVNCSSMSTSDAQLFLKFGEEPKMSVRKGSKVWVEDRNLAWLAAEVIDYGAKQVQLLSVSGKKILISPEKVFPRDADEEEHGGVDDMTKLTYLNEPGVLYNLQRRYALNDIYTYTGSILIAVNPFTKLPHLYNVHMMEQYKGAPFGELSPHVFAVADASYRAMMNEGRSQSILVSGESGAGKTETTKLIMQYLTYVGGRAAGDNRTVEQQVLEDAETYKLGHPSHFHYLNQSRTYELDGVSNAEEYIKTRRAMDIVGISHEEQEAIFRSLAGILHLGNIEFSPGKEHDSSVLKDQKSTFHLQMVANLFMCDVDLLLATLCTRSIQTREGSIVKALDCSAAVAGRDALAKTVYARLFDWLVDKINRSVGQDFNSRVQIGVLDIYGFECFKDNSFEQFCINFANEKLQQHFNEHVFKMEQDEYSKEEINWSYIEFIDNQDVLDLIEKKPIGIIALLDEACMFPRSTHETFSMKLFQHFRSHPRLENAKFSETDFTVSHYAGKVTYHTDTFLDKNRDYVVVEHCNLLSSSKCPLIAGLFPSLPEESSRSSYKFSSVASRFKHQLQALMETLNSTEPHYIRCVKPNSLNQPQKFENLSILHQLRCGGVLEAVRISLAGYPTRKTYSEFVDRFGILAPEFMDGSYDEKAITENILRKLTLENFQLGRTKVFLRAGQIGVLDSRRAEVLDNAAKVIQRQLRTYIAHRDFISTRAASFVLQAYCRGCLARKMYIVKREEAAALILQKHVRSWFARRAYLELLLAAVIIQSSIRCFSTRKRFIHGKKHRAATLIQARWRMFKVRSAFRHEQTSIIAIQCLWRRKLAKRELRRLRQEANEAGALRLAKNKLEKQLEDLTWRLHLEKRLRVSNEEAKSVENSKLQKMLESLNLELDAAKLATINECNKNAVLQNQLELSLKEKSVLERELIAMAELKKENASLRVSLYVLLNLDLCNTCPLFDACHLAKPYIFGRLGSLEEKLSVLEGENHIMRQKALSVSPKSNRPGFAKAYSEKNSGALVVPHTERKLLFESPTPTKLIVPFSHGLSESRRPKLTADRHQENYEFLSRCIKEDLGFIDGKPLAACIIYKCLLHWHAFESERTAIFDYIIEGINDVLKVGDENITLPYWLSNASALLCLLQRNLRSNGFLTTTPQRSAGSTGLAGRIGHGLKSSFKYIGFEDGVTHVEARYPAILFKQQLTACVEKIFGLIRDNLKKELSPLLGLCIQAPKNSRVHVGKSSRSPGVAPQQTPGNQWENIIKFLDSLMSQLRGNHSGLAELEKWIVNAKEEFAGTSWHELNYIRQAVGFLVIHQKRKKSLEEIRQDLCPALTVRQIYRISTMYWDDKYGTQSVSNEACAFSVVAQMREILNKDNLNLTSNSFLLDDDLSIPFSTEDIDMAIPVIDPSDVEIPSFLSEYPCAQFLVQQQN